jgi:arylsulfatase A-like enzyme/Zn-dependent protease with chaperone function
MRFGTLGLPELLLLALLIALLWRGRGLPAVGRHLGKQARKPFRQARWLWGSLVDDEAEALSAEEAFGRECARELAAKFPGRVTPDDQNRVAEIGARLGAAQGEGSRTFEFRAVDTPDPNAFALPGGFVFVTAALLRHFADDRDALAFVVAHEMGHVSLGHARDRYMADLVFGVIGRRVPAAGQVVGEMLSKGYSRDQELEADREALRLLTAAGFQGDGGVRALERLVRHAPEEDGLGGYFSTHPRLDHRIQALRKRAPQGSLMRSSILTIALAGLAAVGSAASAPSARPPQPNVVLIMADDMGYSDLGSYGGEIDTPHIDALAAGGLRYTQFYNTGRCCPTRASLMTGLYPHQAGMGWMSRVDMGRPAYAGELSRNTATLAEVLGAAGYATHMAGKWHLVLDARMRQDAPKESWPLQRGFEQYFGTLAGGGGYFRPTTLVRGNQLIEPPEGFYHTVAVTDDTVRFVEEHARERRGRPFFSYVAYYAPHRPLHALPEDIAKYRGRYDAGWDAVREARYRQMREMGLIDEGWALSARDAPAWDTLSEGEKHNHRRRMEVYAAQIDRLDQGVGRIVEALERTGLLDDTLILFLADNGGCAESQGDDDVTEALGSAESAQSYRRPWANVSNTPFRLYKHWNHEGGVAAPLIVCWPAGIEASGVLRRDPAHVIDVMPTLVELAGARYPRFLGGREIPPMEGVSLVPTFDGRPLGERALFFEHEGHRAVRRGRWKLVADGVDGPWELYDLERDRSETRDLAAAEPALADELERLWTAWATRVDALPLDGSGWFERIRRFTDE